MLNNPEYLQTVQYRNSSNLKARIELHGRFSTNPADWFRWVFDHFQTGPQANILELGSGSGRLWLRNKERLPQGWNIILSDSSAGMIDDAQKTLRDVPHPFDYRQIDAQELPFPDESFDAVIANHMLYHVPDRQKAFSEIQRVLKPGARLFAATNGENHMLDLDSLMNEIHPDIEKHIDVRFNTRCFNLENGAAQLEPWFKCMEIYPYLDSLRVTEAAPLAAYVCSMLDAAAAAKLNISHEKLERFFQERIEKKGAILIRKSTGMFVAIK